MKIGLTSEDQLLMTRSFAFGIEKYVNKDFCSSSNFILKNNYVTFSSAEFSFSRIQQLFNEPERVSPSSPFANSSESPYYILPPTNFVVRSLEEHPWQAQGILIVNY